ncbi:hypothetical protein FB2170_15856 [Maribacter sp. HTCC2170]|nr:hypothetical protein FB2170_15856 [Maribacter sp. HTCC2170]
MFGQEEISWESDKKLYWKDFKGKVPGGSRAAATTASGISYEFSTSYEGNRMLVDYTVSTFFYPTKSWYKPEKCNDVTLAHEQLHFDISELFSRKMRKRMDNATFTKNIKSEVRKIYKEILIELSDYQNRYDDETDFSRNIEQQKVWIKKIEEALKK